MDKANELARLLKALADFERNKEKGRGGRRRNPPPAPYRSWYEVEIAIWLLENDYDFEYESQTLTWVEPSKVKKYKPDFFCEKTKSGRLLIVEAKGIWTAADRKKMCYVLEQNPDLDIRMLFQRDNKIGKSARSKRYSEWCEERNIPYAFGNKIPEEWLDE